MIKLSEVRVGNIVCCNSGMPGTNKPEPLAPWMMRPMASFPNGECQNYDYVPLDEEWLIKMGFGKDIYQKLSAGPTDQLYRIYSKDEYPDFTVLCQHGKKWFMYLESGDPYYDTKGRQIFYVSQVQNLYFALTGEELLIKSI
jgi:hypothetical protein